MIATGGIVDEQDIDTEKQEEYVQLTMDLFDEEFCSCLFVRQSDNKRYGYLKKRLPRGRQKVHKKNGRIQDSDRILAGSNQRAAGANRK